jgi:hypothetical protein
MYRRAGPLTSLQSATGVMLLGVRVTAHAAVNLAEHRRREAAGMAAVIDPACWTDCWTCRPACP